MEQEESFSFNTEDEQNVDFLDDESQNQPQMKIENQPPIQPAAPMSINQLPNIPIVPTNTAVPKPMGLGFNAAPMNNPPTLAAAKPSSGGSRLLLKKTVDKAKDTSSGIENSTIGFNASKNTNQPQNPSPNPSSMHINNIEELDRDPPSLKPEPSEMTSVLPPPPIPAIPKKNVLSVKLRSNIPSAAPSMIGNSSISVNINPNHNNNFNANPIGANALNSNANNMNTNNNVVGSNQNSMLSGPQSLSQGSSSFELFTKMPPVPVPVQNKPLNIAAVSSQPPAQKPIIAQQPILAQQQPILGQQKPIIANQQPVIASQQPVIASQQPVIANQQPVIASQPSKPVFSNQPAQQQPILGQQQEKPILAGLAKQNSIQVPNTIKVTPHKIASTHHVPSANSPLGNQQTVKPSPVFNSQFNEQSVIAPSPPPQQPILAQPQMQQPKPQPQVEEQNPILAKPPIQQQQQTLATQLQEKPILAQQPQALPSQPQQQQQQPIIAQQPIQQPVIATEPPKPIIAQQPQPQANQQPIIAQQQPILAQQQPVLQQPIQQKPPQMQQEPPKPIIQQQQLPNPQQPIHQNPIPSTPQAQLQQPQQASNQLQPPPVQQPPPPNQYDYQQPPPQQQQPQQPYSYPNQPQQQIPPYQSPISQPQTAPPQPVQQQQPPIQQSPVQQQPPQQYPYPQSPYLPYGQPPSYTTAYSPAPYQPPISPPQQPIYISPPPAYIRPTPTSIVEQRFASSLDRSITNFRRFFSMEFSLMMRQPQQSTILDLDFDEYAESLSSEVSQIIEAPLQALDLNASSLSRKIASAIDDQTKPLTAVLSESNARHNSYAEARLAELKQLQDELDSLRSVFKTSAEGVVRELERERANTSSFRNAQLARQTDMEQRMRAVKLRQVELEARATHQNVERESVERQMKTLESRKREWEDTEMPVEAPVKIRQRILSELSNLRREVGQESFEDVAKCVEDALSLVKGESDNMRNELIDIEMANRWVATQIQMAQPSNNMNAMPILNNSINNPMNGFTNLNNINATMNNMVMPMNMPMNMPIPMSGMNPGMNMTMQPNMNLSPTAAKQGYGKIPQPMNKTQIKLNQWRKQREDVVREVKDELS